jgi:hypothetical protein
MTRKIHLAAWSRPITSRVVSASTHIRNAIALTRLRLALARVDLMRGLQRWAARQEADAHDALVAIYAERMK